MPKRIDERHSQGSHPDLDSQLLSYYREQLKRYQQLSDYIRTAGQAPHEDAPNRVREVSAAIAKRDEETESIRKLWQASNATASPELKAVVDEVKQTIQLLLVETEKSTKNIRETQSEVGAKMQQSVLHQRAAEAYRT